MISNQGPDRGERAPDFVLPLAKGTLTRFYARAGGSPTVIIFGSDDDDSLKGLGSRLPDNLSLVVIRPEATPHSMPWPVFTDVEGRVRAAYRLGTGNESVAVVLNPNLRVLGCVLLEQSEGDADKIRSILASGLPAVEALELTTQAPVLLVPHVLDVGLCEHLMKVWQEQGHSATGVEYSQGAQRKDVINPDFKRRQDHTVQDPELIKLLTATIGRRVIPEVQKAFSFQATRFEGFKIACYDAAEEGFFSAHRDNLSPATAHRRFALTLNLNQGHEGGHLRFPEYGPHLYRPGTGGAVVFSGSLLHEVIPVTTGRRFTLLSFLFAEGDVRRGGK